MSTADNSEQNTERLVKRLNIETCYSGRRIRVDEETIELPGGHQTTLEMIRHPGAAAIVPLKANGNLVLIRQYRYAADQWIYELPAGTLDDGESPTTCAERELIEETGYRAGTLSELGFVWTTPGFTDERIFLFLATDLEAVGQELETDEMIEVVEVPFEQALQMVEEGGINDGKSIAALMRAERALSKR